MLRTSLKNVQNFEKTSKSRENALKMTFDRLNDGRVTPQGGLVSPRVAYLLRTSLKNVQNFQKSSKARENALKMTFDRLKDGLVTPSRWPG